MKFRSSLFVIATVLAPLSFAQTPPPDINKGQQTVQQICAACHGVDGNSVAATNPSLAAQHPAYLVKQLKEFKAGTRKNPIMNAQAANLSEQDMANVAAYFANQKLKAREGKGLEVVAAGQAVYRAGNSKTSLPACMACHGPAGTGIPNQFPRLGGQHADYLVAQLNAFKSGERSNDANQTMRDIAGKMPDREIKAVAEYIAGLR